MMFTNPEILRAMLDKLTDALIVYVCHQIDSGAQARLTAPICWGNQSPY